MGFDDFTAEERKLLLEHAAMWPVMTPDQYISWVGRLQDPAEEPAEKPTGDPAE